jgi:hypothetical protein
VLISCEGPLQPGISPEPGSWGGAGIALEITAAGATIEYDCAHGTIDRPIVTDGNGRFSAEGTHVREHGGPIRIDDVPDRHPARYDGEVSGNVMRFSVTLLDTMQSLGPFTAARGVAGRVLKCL